MSESRDSGERPYDGGTRAIETSTCMDPPRGARIHPMDDPVAVRFASSILRVVQRS